MTNKRSYQHDLIESLKHRREAVAYLNAAIEDGDRGVFLLAIRNVVKAQGGMTAVAERANLNRENLYRMLSGKGNPQITSLSALLRALGFKLTIAASPSKAA